MRQLLLLTLLFTCNALFSQDYPFLSPSSKKRLMSDYVDHLNAYEGKSRDSVLQKLVYYTEDGKLRTAAYSDSIFKSKESYKYRTLVYKDTLLNSYSFVLHKRTDAEIKADGEYWKKHGEDDEKNRKALLGSKLDELTLTDIDGNVHTLESLRGKIIVIDFWFVNCHACVEEMPELNKMREEFGTKDIAWFGITFDDKEKTLKFLEKKRFDFTVIPNGRAFVDRFSIRYFPTTLIIDTDNKIVYTGKLNAMKSRADEIRKALIKTVKDMQKNQGKK